MGRVFLALGIVIGLAAATAVAAVPTFDTTRLYSEEAFVAATKPYTDAIARNANDADAHHWLGVAYSHAFMLFKFSIVQYAGGYGARAVASLERAVQLNAGPAAMLALAQAYIAVGERDKYAALMDRLGALAQPVPLK